MQKRGLFWLVVWNMNFIFPNSWDDDPIWPTHIFQWGRSTTNQINNHYPTIKNSDFPVRYVMLVYQAGYGPIRFKGLHGIAAVVPHDPDVPWPLCGQWTSDSKPSKFSSATCHRCRATSDSQQERLAFFDQQTILEAKDPTVFVVFKRMNSYLPSLFVAVDVSFLVMHGWCRACNFAIEHHLTLLTLLGTHCLVNRKTTWI